MRVADALAAARAAGVARLDAQLLLAHHLRQTRAWLLAHDDVVLDGPTRAAVDAGLARRAAGEPLAYVLGECVFRGLRLRVTPAVLIPRPETELIVDWALARLASAPAAPAVLDLGTGSGAIALAIKHAAPAAAVSASDASGDALAVARANALALGLNVECLCGDWWAPVDGRDFDLVVSNPPYVAAGDPHLAALRAEPQGALTPGGDGLGALRRIVAGAPAHLRAGATLLLEHGHDQAAAVQRLLRDAGFAEIATRADLAGLPRCTGGVWPPGRTAAAAGSGSTEK